MAYVYFYLMLLIMLPLTWVHWECRRVVGKTPDIMPDATERDRYRWAELAMAFTCLAMLFYMNQILPQMVTFCATNPVDGFIAHAPWIFGTCCILIAKTGHLMRLRAKAALVSG